MRDRLCGDRDAACRAPRRARSHQSIRVWISEYAGAPYQEVAAKARTQLDGLAKLYATPAREADLIAIFKEATRLEADFWEMGWRADERHGTPAAEQAAHPASGKLR